MDTCRVLGLLAAACSIVAGCDDGEPDADADADVVADADADADADGDGDGDTDADADADSDEEVERCPAFPDWERGGDGATDLTLPPAAGGAVAGRITSEAQLLRGLKPKGRVGDVLMGNSKIAVVIEAARVSDGYSIAGGEVLDVDHVGPGGPLGESLFDEMFQGILPQVFTPEDVTVVADGSDGGAAVVRVTGRLGAMWLLDACCPGLFPGAVTFPFQLDYVLEPEAEAVQMRLRLRNDTVWSESTLGLLLVLMGGDDVSRYAPSVGFDEDENFGLSDYVALIGERISYAWVPESGQIQYVISTHGVQIYTSGGAAVLPACAETELVGGRLVVGGGDVSTLESALRRERGEEPLPAITGVVRAADGAPVAGARVHATDGAGVYLSMARADAEGRYRLEVGPGEVRLQAWAGALRPTPVAAVTHGAAGTVADLEFGPSGVLAWDVRELAAEPPGEEIPAKVSVVPLDEAAPSAPSEFGEPDHPNGAVLFDFALPGRHEAALSTGRYRLVASRGYEYELEEVDVTIEADATTLAEPALARSVDTEGWLCGDFHVHTMYSPDSDDVVEWKVRSATGVGLELPVSTDHEYISDLQPVVESLGLTRWVRWFHGEEITTFTFGHFNAYPLPQVPGARNQGAIDWVGLLPGEVFDRVRDVATDPVLQINHPRSDSAGGYFTYVDLDPDTLEAGDPAAWSTNFDAVEVFNGSGWQSNRDATVRDWFGLLNHGHLITAMGNSDSHTAEWSDVGYPRSCLRLDETAPGDVAEETMRDAVRAGRVVVSGGLFVTTETLDGVGPGGVAAAPGGSATVRVRIQAPTWVDADAAEIVVNGATVETITLDETTEDPENPVVRLDREVEVLLDADGWMVVGAWASGDLGPVTPGSEPFGASNAIFFDVDGDGEYAGSGRTVE